jgi:alpha-tubulin suppressor-like RCC1 family protein
VPEAVAGAPSFARVFSGKQLNCGIGGDGAAFCWGSQPAPVAGGHRFARLSLGGTPFACGTTVDSDAYCWGEGSAGQLGNGTTVQSAVPVAVAGGHRWNDVSAGMAHACGLNTAGAAFCWGSNSAAQLGNSSYAPSATPVAVGEGHTFASVSAGGNSSCGLDAGGTAYCWGALRAPGGVISPAPPAAVAGGLTFRSITVGDDHACGLTTAGRAYCWGSNYWGQVGNGTSAAGMVAEPAPVAGGLTFTQLTAGYGFACGVTSNGAAYCWGYGVNGQLGNGGTGSSTIPVRMIDPV